MKLDFDSLYREALGDAFTEAKKKFYDNRIQSVSAASVEGKTMLSATVKGKSDRHCRIVFDEQGGLYDYGCDCSDFNMASGPCKHVLAAALAYEELNPSAAAPARVRLSDGVVPALIAGYGRDRRKIRFGREISLIPTLVLDSMTLTFHIGSRKSYRLKDLNDFSSAVEGRAYRRYGAELAFYHFPSNFDERSVRLIKMILASNAKAKGGLALSGYALDEFLDIYSGSFVKTEKNGSPDGVKRVVPSSPEFKVEVRRVEEGFMVDSDLKGSLIRGGKSDYLITDNEIYLIAEGGEALSSFISAAPFFVSEEDMFAFYNNVLAQLSAHARIESDLDLTVYAAPPLTARLYLDFDGTAVYGELKAFYGDAEADLESESRSEYRDAEAETELKDTLREFFPDYPSLELSDENGIYALLRDGLNRLYGRAEIFLSENFKGLKITSAPSIRVGVKREGALLDLSFDTDGMDGERLRLILEGIRTGKKFIRLGESFVDLSEASRSLRGILSLPVKNGKVAAYYSQYIRAELEEGGIGRAEPAEKEEIRLCQPAPALKSVMRPYQITGYAWLKAVTDYGYGGILADDMGLGKSVQTIALINDLLQTSDLPVLIVCPTTLILNWVEEFKKFLPSVIVRPISGTLEERLDSINGMENKAVAITSYELLRRDALYYKQRFSLIVADEAQYIKNPLTKNAGAIKSVAADRRLALTGTPIENSLSELWSIFDFLMPGYLFDYETFRENFEVGVAHGDTDAGERLKKMISPFVLRRMKSEVLKELPPKIETTVAAPLADKQLELYTAHVKLIKESLGKKTGRLAVLSLITKLRQICCDPGLITSDYEGNSAKLEALMQLLDNAILSGHKVLVFSQFTSMLDVIAKRLDQSGYAYYVLKGETPKAERIRLVNDFNRDGTGVFLISLKAGGTGINLTGADIVIHYDPWWNDSVMNQATDRSYRIGQNKSVQVYKLILSGTVEEKIMELQKSKAKLGESFTGTSDALGEIIDYVSQL